MSRPPSPFLICLLLSFAVAIIAPVHLVHADDLTEGMTLYRAQKYREAVPYLEKAAKEGHEEAISALDKIYENDTPAVAVTDKSTAPAGRQSKITDKNSATGINVPEQPAPQYEKATVSKDPEEAANRAFMRKVMFLGTAGLIVVIWIVQYFLLRRLRNQNFRKATPEEQAAEAKKNGKKS